MGVDELWKMDVCGPNHTTSDDEDDERPSTFATPTLVQLIRNCKLPLPTLSIQPLTPPRNNIQIIFFYGTKNFINEQTLSTSIDIK